MAKKPLGKDKLGVQKVMRMSDYLGDAAGQFSLNAISGLIGQLTYFYTDKVGVAAGAIATITHSAAWAISSTGECWESRMRASAMTGSFWIRGMASALAGRKGLTTACTARSGCAGRRLRLRTAQALRR